MQSTGIIRRVDYLGRVAIPKELRRTNNIKEGDPMEIFVSEEGGITFVPYETTLGRALDTFTEKVQLWFDEDSVYGEEILGYLNRIREIVESEG